MTVRGDILNEASRLINGPKQDDYGPPAVNFGNIAVGWQVILGCAVSAEQVARCMAWLKIARLNTGPHTDSYIDGAGYMALAAELAVYRAVKPDGAVNPVPPFPELIVGETQVFPDAWRGPVQPSARPSTGTEVRPR